MQANEELSAVLRGGLHGRFQSAFHLLENALEVLDDNIAHSVTPAKYDDLHPLLQQVGEQLLLLRRLGEHAADAAIAPVLQDVCVPQPMDLLEQLREIGALFQEIAVQQKLDALVELCPEEGLQSLFTMGDPTLLNGLLANLFSNSLAAGRSVHVTPALCAGGFLLPGRRPGAAAGRPGPAAGTRLERAAAGTGRPGPAADPRLCPGHGLGAARGGCARHESAFYPCRPA